jgi:hypothetical protein
MSTEGGAPGCDPQKQAVEKYDHKVRLRARRITASRTGKMVPLDQVHLDPRSCDTFQRLMEVILRAVRDWKPGGMPLEAWVDFRLAHTDADASFFDSPLTVPYGVAMDYLGAVRSSLDLDEQKADWVARGRNPVDFDTIYRSQSFDQPTLPGDWTAFLGEERFDEPYEKIPCAQPDTDALAEVRLFLTLDLTDVEQMVLRYHDQYGYTFEKIGRDLLPDHLFERSGNVEHKARRIYLKAMAKAEDFRNIEGSAL